MQLHGEIGVLAEDGERVQCHICGKWFKFLDPHLRKAHVVSSADYKSTFGLNRTQALIGSALREHKRTVGAPILAEYQHLVVAPDLTGVKLGSRLQGNKNRAEKLTIEAGIKGRNQALAPESKEKRKASLKGKPKSPEHIANAQKARKAQGAPWNTGRVLSAETKAKISEKAKGRQCSEETRAKISETTKGRPGRKHSEETRRKLSESRKAYLKEKQS